MLLTVWPVAPLCAHFADWRRVRNPPYLTYSQWVTCCVPSFVHGSYLSRTSSRLGLSSSPHRACGNLVGTLFTSMHADLGPLCRFSSKSLTSLAYFRVSGSAEGYTHVYVRQGCKGRPYPGHIALSELVPDGANTLLIDLKAFCFAFSREGGISRLIWR